MSAPLLLRIAVPVPLRRSFDYLPPVDLPPAEITCLQPGTLVEIPFGNRQLIGVLLAVVSDSEIVGTKLKAATRLVDPSPAFSAEVQELVVWAANYYQCAMGEALSTALPALLRQGAPLVQPAEPHYQLTHEGKGLPEGALRRAPKQAAVITLLQQCSSLSQSEMRLNAVTPAILKSLQEKGLIRQGTPAPQPEDKARPILREQPMVATAEQQQALDHIATEGFQVSLLDGTTGSGKTEIYLQSIEKVLEKGLQALVLVPEIGLTPQTISRFTRRFAVPVVALHSGLSDRERLDAWLDARSGKARIVIGTRSAVFTPLATPGIIIIDEEHDASFKQQDGFRYSARDIAVMRASKLQIPLLLGSATPSLETLGNAMNGRYQHLRLTQRAGNAQAPTIHLVDLCGKTLHEGFARETLDAIQEQIHSGNQVLVFLNRRGFAPALQCHDCGWLANCNHCDARMTLHHHPKHLHCHHCGHQRAVLRRCPQCQGQQLQPLGQGTERSEIALQSCFPDTRVIRIDRDSTRRKGAMENLLDEIQRGDPCILIGTQMLAKGHHFPNVTLVVILDADAGLFSTDFRGPERMGQLLLQVAGRAGRAEKPGQVIMQSHHTDHPLVQTLMYEGYHALATLILQERQITQMPPFRHLALLRAESKRPELASAFLQLAREMAENHTGMSPAIEFLGPLPALMEKRGDRYRYLLQFSSQQRKPLQHLLATLALQLEQHALGKRVRWSLDVDPCEMN